MEGGCLANPAPDCARVCDTRQLIERRPELHSELGQPVLLFGRERYSLRQFAPQDFVFHLQVADLSCQFLLC